MGSTNQNNTCGSRANQPKHNCESNSLSSKKLGSMLSTEEISVSCQDSYPYSRGPHNNCTGEINDCTCNNHIHPMKPCDSIDRCSYHKHEDDCDVCNPINNCGTGETCRFIPNRATCVCTYMGVVYDDKVASGPTLFEVISATIPNFTITSEYTQNTPCCNSCAIDSTSVFTVDKVKATIKSFTLQFPASISTSNVLIGGQNALSVTPFNNGFTAVANPAVLDPECTCKHKGTMSNVLITGLTDWNITARYEYCGRVTTNDITCKFKIVVENTLTNPTTISNSLTFIASEVFLPPSDLSSPPNINANFIGCGQLINPVITAIGGPAPMPVTLTVGGNLMLNTQADVVVTKNEKVYLQGMVKHTQYNLQPYNANNTITT